MTRVISGTSERSLMERLAIGGESRQASQLAFYNAAFLAILGLCLAALYAVYQILFMFLGPLISAMLFGTVVFPLKQHVSTNLRGWLSKLEEEGTPLLLGIAVLPLQLVARFATSMYDTALSQRGTFCMGAYVLLKMLSFEGVLDSGMAYVTQLHELIDNAIGLSTRRWVFILIVPYLLAYFAWICMQDAKDIPKKLARALSLPIWIWVVSHLANLFGIFRVLVFLATAVLLGLISAGKIAAGEKEWNDEEEQATPAEVPIAEEREALVEPSGWRRQSKEEEAKIALADAMGGRFDTALSSDMHLQMVAALCLLLLVVHHDLLLIFILIPLIGAAVARGGEKIGLKALVEEGLWRIWNSAKGKFQQSINIVVAGSLRKFVRVLFTSDRIFISSLRQSVDFISTIAVMAGLAVSCLLLTLFVCFQIHGETVQLVKLGKETVTSHPEWLNIALNYTEGQLREHDFDRYVEQAYQQGKQWLAANIRSVADPRDEKRGEQLEQQVNLLMDNLYHLWEKRNMEVINDTTTSLSPGRESDGMKQLLLSATNLASLREELTSIVSRNFETFVAIARSCWSLVIVNLSLLTTLLLWAMWLVLGFGMDLLNFFIEVAVFLTLLYYLLANSDEEWLPLKWFNSLIPSISRQLDDGGLSPRRSIGQAVQQAVNGVFVLSAKMSLFYGLYTYFLHSLFGLHIIFIPSIMAAVLAGIPIVPPYSVGLLGCIELLLGRHGALAAVLFAMLCVAPLFFADPAFYKEIKGSHPYVTGLALIGGIYWLGPSGAIVGPIILCCVTAIVNLYAEFAAGNTD